MARSVHQYEQPRCPENWKDSEKRFYNRLIEVLDEIYAKYGLIDNRTLLNGIQKVESMTRNTLNKLDAGTITAGTVATDALSATFGYIASLSGKYGNFDFQTVKDLVAQAMVLEKGQADYIHITNLSATYAQAVNATIGNLCIQSSDGKYYQLDVKPDGTVSAQKVELTDGEIAAGQTDSGKVIVGTHITAETLGTETLAATQALVNTIDAARINVAELVARDAFIQVLTASDAFIHSLIASAAFIETLRTVKIVGDNSIEMIAMQAGDAAKTYRQEDAPLGSAGVNVGDLWVVPGTEQVYQAEDAAGEGLQFYFGSDGALYYTVDVENEDTAVEMQEYDLYASGILINVSADGEIGAAYRWAHVQDQVLVEDIIAGREAFDRVVRIDDDGLHVGDSKTTNEVLIDSDSVNIVIENEKYSKFAAQYVQFGNYKIGLAEDDGLMFKPM